MAGRRNKHTCGRSVQINHPLRRNRLANTWSLASWQGEDVRPRTKPAPTTLTILLGITLLVNAFGMSVIHAEDMGSISSGQTVSGVISAVGEKDSWTFTGQAGDRIILDVENTSGSLNSYYLFYPPDGGTYELSQYQWAEHVLAQSGTYTIVVYDNDLAHTGSYNMTLLNLREGDPSAQSISSGETLSGTIDAPSDMAVVQFTGQAGDRIILDMENTSGSLNSYYLFYPPDGGSYELSDYQWYEHVLQQSGTYTIVIYDYHVFYTGSYNMTLLNLREGDPSAQSISSGETLSGTIDAPSDMAVVQFSCEAGVKVKITVTPTSGPLDSYFLLYPPDGGTYEASGHRLLEHVLQQSGVYTVVVYDNHVFYTGSYNITLTGGCGGQCSLMASSSSGGSVTSPGHGMFTYDCGVSIPVVASADAGYAFTGWTGTAVTDGKVAAPGSVSTTVMVDAEYTLVANFSPLNYHVTISSSNYGSVTSPGEGVHEYAYGTQLPIVATPESDCQFIRWTGSAVDSGKVADSAAASTTVIVDGDYTLVAQFGPLVEKTLPVVETAGVSGLQPRSAWLEGTLVSDGNDTCEYQFGCWGESVYYATSWTCCVNSEDTFSQFVDGLTPGTVYSYEARARNSVGEATGSTMTFRTPVQLTISASEGGKVIEPGIGEFQLPEAQQMNVLAQADPNYYFWCWQGSAVEKGRVIGDVGSPDVVVLVDADHTLQAMFLPVVVKLSDDRNPAPCRGEDLNTSQFWRFDEGGNATKAGLQELCQIDGAAPGGQPPLPGTSLSYTLAMSPDGSWWWATDTKWGSQRGGLLALGELWATLHVPQPGRVTTTVWVQILWHSGDDPQAIPMFHDMTPAPLNPPIVIEEQLDNGWRHSTYVWDVVPDEEKVSFAIGGKVVVDTLIVDTCTQWDQIHVDDDAVSDPGPDDITISDPDEAGTPEHPFDSIQEGIDAASDGATVIVHPGRYTETIDLLGKAVTVTGQWLIDDGAYGAAVLDANGAAPAVRFVRGEGPDCVLAGLTIMGGKGLSGPAIVCEGTSPSISHCILCGNMALAGGSPVIACRDSHARYTNCTITGNRAGLGGPVFGLTRSTVVVLDSIIWGNEGQAFEVGLDSTADIKYCDIEGHWSGPGIIGVDPLFADPGFWNDMGTPGIASDDLWILGDYHLLSWHGRFSPDAATWISDAMDSPCIDAGNPDSSWYPEPVPHGNRINMGAYGATRQASKSP